MKTEIKEKYFETEEKDGKTEFVKKEKNINLKPKSSEKEITLEDKDFFLIKSINDLTSAIKVLTARMTR